MKMLQLDRDATVGVALVVAILILIGNLGAYWNLNTAELKLVELVFVPSVALLAGCSITYLSFNKDDAINLINIFNDEFELDSQEIQALFHFQGSENLVRPWI